MTPKSILCKRLSTAIGKTIPPADFTWFFKRFCEAYEVPPKVRTAKTLDEETVMAFSRYAGYDLRFPIPLPLWAEK